MTKVPANELDYTKVRFEDLGYFVEYLVGGKLIGTKNVKENDRDGKIGYASTEHHIADTVINFKHKKIKIGTEYQTRIYPLCGKVIKNK